jgi:hypothetical protein
MLCSKCNQELPEGSAFCNHCGANISPEAQPAPTPLAPVQSQPKPQGAIDKLKGSKKGKLIVAGAALLVLVVVLVAVLGGKGKKNSSESYLHTAQLFAEACALTAIDLEKVADTVQEYWYDYIYNDKRSYGGLNYAQDIDDAIRFALDDTEDAQARAVDAKKNVDTLYKTLRSVPKGKDSRELEEVYSAAKELYTAYDDFYRLATNPTGNYNSFSADNKAKTDAFISKLRALRILAGDDLFSNFG